MRRSTVVVVQIGIAVLLSIWAGGANAASVPKTFPAHDGLGPKVAVPDWAKGKSIHFLPAVSTARQLRELEASTRGSGAVHNRYEPYCSKTYCPSTPLNYVGGRVQHHPNVHLIFWGSDWNEGTFPTVRAQIQGLFTGLNGSEWDAVLAHYFDQGGRISPNLTTSSYTDSSVWIPENVNDAAIRAEVNRAVTATGWAREPDAQFIVMPAGATYENGFDREFCGYHETDHATGSSYAFVPYPQGTFAGCAPNNPGANMSVAASHEFAEAVTDPDPVGNPGWIDSNGYEISDICLGEPRSLPNGSYATANWDNLEYTCSTAVPYRAGGYAMTGQAEDQNGSSTTLKGYVLPEGAATTYHFDYGTTTGYGLSTQEVSAGSGTAPVVVSAPVSGLAPTTYHFRLVATGAGGAVSGGDRTINMGAAITEAATEVTGSSAKLWGSTHAAGTVYFEYGKSTSYGTKIESQIESEGGRRFRAITGLEPGTTYHFRIGITGDSKTQGGRGNDMQFTTPGGAPRAQTKAASAVTSFEATMMGEVTPEGFDTHYWFEYGPTTSYGTTVPSPTGSAGQGFAAVPVQLQIGRLELSHTYHYRLVASSIRGTVYGADQQFTTSPRREWLVEGKSIAFRELSEEAVKGSGGAFTMAAPVLGSATKISCGSTSSSGSLIRGGTGVGSLKLSSCSVLEPSGCTMPSSIELAFKTERRVIGSKSYEWITPSALRFAEVVLGGATCPLAGSVVSPSGTLAGEIEQGELQLASQPIGFSTAINEAAGAVFKIGKNAATVSGGVVQQLAGQYAGKPWGFGLTEAWNPYEWQVGGQMLATGGIQQQVSVNGGSPGHSYALSGTVLGLTVKMSCGYASESGAIYSGGGTTANLQLSSCSVSQPAGCALAKEPALTMSGELKVVGSTIYEVFKPAAGEYFTEISFSGVGCPLSGTSMNVKGSIAGAFVHGETPEKLQAFSFSPTVQEAAGAELKLGKSPLQMSGYLQRELAGGISWSPRVLAEPS